MKRRDRIGIIEIAQRAGVSPATVSRVLNNQPNSRISAETRERVRSIAQDAGYVVNRLAMSLRTKRTGVFGAMVSSLSGHYQPHLASRLQAVAQRRGIELLVAQARPGAEEARGQLGVFQDDFFDGIILLSDLPGHAALCAHLDRMGKPHVTLCGGLDGPRPAVMTDDHMGIDLIFEHLAELGHQRIDFVHRVSRKGVEDRRTLFEAAGQAGGGSVLLLDRGEAGQQQLRRWMDRRDRPTALICGSDGIAVEVLAFLHDAGWQVPGDVSVIGYDNVPDSAFWSPPLTTVAMPTDALCEASLDMLAARIALPAEARRHDPPVVRIPPRLVIRASSSPPSVRIDPPADR